PLLVSYPALTVQPDALSRPAALPISIVKPRGADTAGAASPAMKNSAANSVFGTDMAAYYHGMSLLRVLTVLAALSAYGGSGTGRSEEHTSELQSRENLVCRRLLDKKK